MIVNVDLRLSKPEMPTDYRPLMVSLIKAVMSKNYPEDYERLFASGPVRKPYTFAVRLPRPRFEGDRVLLDDVGVKMSLSSADEREVLLLYNAFQKSRGYCHPMSGGAGLAINKVMLQPSPEVVGNTAVIKLLSPLAVRSHDRDNHDRYCVYSDDDFDDCLNTVISYQLGQPAEIKLEPIKPGKTVVRAFGGNIRASIGTYRITATQQLINDLLRGGVGSRRGEGFGFITLEGR